MERSQEAVVTDPYHAKMVSNEQGFGVVQFFECRIGMYPEVEGLYSKMRPTKVGMDVAPDVKWLWEIIRTIPKSRCEYLVMSGT